jgi:hypothetical protein
VSILSRALVGAVAGTLFAAGAPAQDNGPTRGAPPFYAIQNEPAPKLYVDPPLAAPLARGAVVIAYRFENFRILPIFGEGADNVSPRAGHLHVTVDDLPWHWADVSQTNDIVVVGLPAGPHKIRIELAAPDHKVFTGETVSFTVPAAAHQH